MRYTTYRHARDNAPKPAEWAGPDDLGAWLRSPVVVADEKKRPAWSPALYDDPTHTRAAAHVSWLSAVVLDYDDGTPWDVAVGHWSRWGGAAHTSWSHEPGWRPLPGYPDPSAGPLEAGYARPVVEAAPRLRVIVPLLSPAPAAIWPRVWAWAAAQTGGVIDPKCKDASRIYYAPCHRPGEGIHYRWDMWGGPLLDWRTLELPPDPNQPARVIRPVKLDGLPAGVVAAYESKRMEYDPEIRARWVTDNGGRIVQRGGARVGLGMTCPQCGRPDLCLWIDWDKKRAAWCNHAKTCGYHGSPWRT
jgi:hypothetical protein